MLTTKHVLKRKLLLLGLYLLFGLTKMASRNFYAGDLSLQGYQNQYLSLRKDFDLPVDRDDYHNSWLSRKLLAMQVVRPHPSMNCTPLAIDNFPRDVFTQSQRQYGAVIIHLIVSIYMFIGLALLCDEYFIPCLERICEVLHLQPDVAGATFMAAGSSAPELATTLVGVFIAKDDIGLGAVVGSADFNIMLVVSVSALFAKQVIYLNWWPLVRDSAVYLLSIILLALVIYDELVYWYESALLILVYGLYVLLMYYNPPIDAFWRVWCREHPTFCPRTIHADQQEDPDHIQQHSGAFGHFDIDNKSLLPNPICHEPVSIKTGYKRFEENEENYFSEKKDYATEKFGSTGRDMDNQQRQQYCDTTTVTLNDDVETQVRSGSTVESWSDTCFTPLKLPSREGIRGKIRYAFCAFLWPLRCALCLTVPDVRKARWRQIPASHWLSFIMSCFWIGVFTVIMMWMITVIGVTLHIPDTIMGLTFIAAGSSVPDAIASVIVVREGEGDMAVSNAVGSNVFDILICMGLPWLMKAIFSQTPIVIYSRGLLYSTLTLFTTVIYLLAATHINRWRLTKSYGYALLIGYVIVLIFCSLYELNYFGTVHLPPCPFNE
ncbi:putative sodium/potassium/calcium exchanger [Schistosoma japonicum]|nr:putative sodium/potassium/calcium exchanger [Schistosoma japonicum]